jgi:hypothetical protein
MIQTTGYLSLNIDFMHPANDVRWYQCRHKVKYKINLYYSILQALQKLMPVKWKTRFLAQLM